MSSILFVGCATTSFYTEEKTEVITTKPKDTSIHYVKDTTDIKVEKTTNGSMIAFYTIGAPVEIVGCTVRETGRAVWYGVANLFVGAFTFAKGKADSNELNDCVYLPDLQKDKDELAKMNKEYEESEIYKNRKYASKFSYNTITKTRVVENVYWNDKKKKLKSSTETVKAEASVSDSAKRISKKASVIGDYVGKGFAYVIGFPAFCIGFFIGSLL